VNGARARLKLVESPADPDLVDLSALMDVVFADPNTVLGLDRMQEFLAANRPGAARRFCVLVACGPAPDGVVVGGSVFSYVARSNCGFSEYLVADRAARGRGLGRQLFDERRNVLDAEARRLGQTACRGIFIEVDSPDRTPADLLDAERETALDAWERLRLFEHLGFRRVAAPYVQPPLAATKQAIDYLDLLFAPWYLEATTQIPADWIVDTLEAIWSAWTPTTAGAYLHTLKERIAGKQVALELLSRPSS